MNKEKEDIIKNVEFLIKKLHEEWEQHGDMKKAITMNTKYIKTMKDIIVKRINDQQKKIETKTMSFKNEIILSKENYVLIRIIREIKKQEENARKNNREDFLIILDEEEVKLFQKIVGVKV